MPRRRLYNEPLYRAVTSTSEEFVEGHVVESGLILFVTHAALEDETNAPTTISFGKKVGDRYEGLEEDEAPSAGIRYHTAKTHHFLAGEKPCWRVEGATSADKLRGYMEGYYEEV